MVVDAQGAIYGEGRYQADRDPLERLLEELVGPGRGAEVERCHAEVVVSAAAFDLLAARWDCASAVVVDELTLCPRRR